MKTYYIIAALTFLLAYSVFHFGFRTGGDGQLYRINDRIAFELHTPDDYFNGIAIRSYRRTKSFVQFICGACEIDSDGVIEMVNVKYRNGYFIYTDTPQHETALTDIVNVKTGETINAQIPVGFKFGDDFSKLPEYQIRGLTAGGQFVLDQNYVRANFSPLSTFTERCFYGHLIFAAALILLSFPKLLLRMIEALSRSNDPLDPANYHRAE